MLEKEVILECILNANILLNNFIPKLINVSIFQKTTPVQRAVDITCGRTLDIACGRTLLIMSAEKQKNQNSYRKICGPSKLKCLLDIIISMSKYVQLHVL